MQIGYYGGTVFQVSYFKVLTLEELERTTRHRYATHEILNGVTKLESVGREPLGLTLKITLMRELNVDPEVEADKLYQMCMDGRAEYLVIGNKVIGNCRFVLEEVTGRVERFAGVKPSLLRLTLKLKEYANGISNK